ncbi:hypothetical protein JCM3775_001612 [Rhodotorula graminis]|uniref:Uncharacterized protein n=1 Tax=Rhodotorula graminis (strain WP1) TaxID=578459 RepID=A0A194S1D4_RHOGW|nr:uncharacterized protein RHOBADRAFT_54170 [Rhodotorula graminis WP1]KPV74329.1 hypothetical protein RHOBADRAFT_54170 [Rhodotorula graminis WP1]
MDTINKIVDQGKNLVNQYTSTDSSTSSSTSAATTSTTSQSHAQPPAVAENEPSGADALVPDVGDSLGVTGGVDRLTTDHATVGDETGAGVAAQDGEPAYEAYSTAGRDATGTFDGGANENPPTLGAGQMPQ